MLFRKTVTLYSVGYTKHVVAKWIEGNAVADGAYSSYCILRVEECMLFATYDKVLISTMYFYIFPFTSVSSDFAKIFEK
jgi:hypothetical protein